MNAYVYAEGYGRDNPPLLKEFRLEIQYLNPRASTDKTLSCYGIRAICIAYNIHWSYITYAFHMIRKYFRNIYESDKMFIGRWTRVQKWEIYEKEVNR